MMDTYEPPEYEVPYDTLVVSPGEIDALFCELRDLSRRYEDPAHRQAYRDGAMQALAILEDYYGVSFPTTTSTTTSTTAEDR